MPSGRILDQKCSIWRRVLDPVTGNYDDKQIFVSIPCSIEPVSGFDAQVPYAYESTHTIWLPFWLTLLRKEDLIKTGRRLDDGAGDVMGSWVYTIQGRRPHRMSIPTTTYFAREQD